LGTTVGRGGALLRARPLCYQGGLMGLPLRARFPRLPVLVAAGLLLALHSLPGRAANAADDPEGPETAMAPVELDGYRLFRVAGTSARPAPERAEVIAGRIREVAADRSFTPVEITTVPRLPLGLDLRANDQLLLTVTSVDAQREGVGIELLAEIHRQKIVEAINRYREERSRDFLLRGAGIAAVATLALALAVVLVSWLFRQLDALLERRSAALARSLASKLGDAMRVHPVLQTMRRSALTLRWVALALLAFAWLEVVLVQFPWTRGLGSNLADLVVQPVGTIFMGMLDYLPKLVFLLVLGVVTRFVLRLLRLYFGALERGTAHLPGFEREWSLATYKIVRVVVLAIALVMAYPYLPGAGSEALQGVSVFAGLLLSLGASASVANVIAGYITTFGRVLRVGDLIEVGGVRGVVTQIRLLTVRLRTIRNEEVTVPNSIIMNSNVTNFSALARDGGGLTLQTEVGIGYEVPWRQVHAMLVEAAGRTKSVLAEPPPFVVQRQLGDFAVVYQLNVRKADADGLFLAYSELHQNILDVFNEYGVQIMTPAYEGDPELPKVVPKERWFDQPAAPPAPPR
jgi:small-conductance mechanosensitive channel